MLISCIVYKCDEMIEDALTLYGLLLDCTTEANIIPYAKKLVGPLIRISHYQLE